MAVDRKPAGADDLLTFARLVACEEWSIHTLLARSRKLLGELEAEVGDVLRMCIETPRAVWTRPTNAGATT
jgi:hypothetical protein